jgi:diadenylate cyclase
MSFLSGIWQQILSLFSSLIVRPDWRNILDIVIVSVLVYQLIKALAHTRANTVLKGVLIVILITGLAELLQLNALSWLLLQMLNIGALLLVILFQPEIRRGLDQLGRSRWRLLFGSTKDVKAAEKVAQEMTAALLNLSKRRVGALVVIERGTALGDVVESGTALDAEISQPLLENIFEPNTPLHDGAVVISALRIAAAACILQLSDDNSISRELGTRHRAAIGISESTDAVTLIVSEETGIISVARGGRLTRHLDAKSLLAVLMELFVPADAVTLSSIFRRKEGGHETE